MNSHDMIASSILSYQQFTNRTAQYPTELALPYVGLGLCDEAVELEDAADRAKSGLSVAIRAAIIAELGDVLWYCARIALHKELSLAFVWSEAVSLELDVVPDMRLMARCITRQAGSLAGKIKKELRDGTDCTAAVVERIGMILRAAEAMCTGLQTTLVDVMAYNQRKLEDRLSRNVIKGSGDNR